jgi:hypothetical protein
MRQIQRSGQRDQATHRPAEPDRRRCASAIAAAQASRLQRQRAIARIAMAGQIDHIHRALFFQRSTSGAMTPPCMAQPCIITSGIVPLP